MNSNTYENKLKIVIVGGVAGGASCATRARRLSESAEIIIMERGEYVSFANCGLPYYVGDVITDEENLIVATPELFRDRFNIDVRPRNNVLSIDREKQEIEVEDLNTSQKYKESYDALVLAPGASPIRPSLPGIDLPGIFSLRNIPDSRNIRDWIVQNDAKSAVVVGGGFIGLEMAENLIKRGLSVTVIEMMDHVMPTLDYEMASQVYEHLITKGISIKLEDAVAGFEPLDGSGLITITQSGDKVKSDMVILAIGVKPETGLAVNAGLEIGSKGGIRVNDRMQTSDKHIWAIGDAVEVKEFVTGENVLIPLAGPANRQGRIVAGIILGRDFKFRGVQATAVCGILGMTVASTGVTEKTLRRLNESGRNIKYEKVYLHPWNHADYYPDAKRMVAKLIFSTEDGKILGAQMVGYNGIEKRIDVISMAIQTGGTVFDLEEAELCYAPQYGGAKDPVNMAGMVAANVLRGDTPLAHWEDRGDSNALLLDVRDQYEYESGKIKGAVSIPLHELRSRLSELPSDQEIWTYCPLGQRSYYAVRILKQNGYNARTISGGMNTYWDIQ